MLLAGSQLWGQEPEYLKLVKAESHLHTLFNTLYSDSLTAAEPLIEEILSIMTGALAMPGAMEYPWSRLDRIGVKTSEDGLIRIFTWHVMDDPDTYRYFGYIQLAQKRGEVSLFPLMDNFRPQRGVYRLEQSAEDWYGKLCYGIITSSVKRKTYYTLLGMDFNNSRSNMKFVEMMVIQRNKPQFVRNSFSNGKDVVDRVVLEYSNYIKFQA